MPKIQPEDQTPLENLTIKVRQDELRQMRAYARWLQNSSVDYILTAFFRDFGAGDKEFIRACAEDPGLISGGIVEKDAGVKRGPKGKGRALAAVGG